MAGVERRPSTRTSPMRRACHYALSRGSLCGRARDSGAHHWPRLQCTQAHHVLEEEPQFRVAQNRRISKVPIESIVDSTGLSIVGQGEWAPAKHGNRGKQVWKERHIGVDHAAEGVAQVLTGEHVDYARTGIERIEPVEGDLNNFIGDAAYDTAAISNSLPAVDAEPLSCRR